MAALDGQHGLKLFRLPEEAARQVMGNDRFELACEFGWLNMVDRDSTTNKPVYAFFHATFQEYFAALTIDDWDFFLPRTHVDRPIPNHPYRIFKPQWKETYLLWLGQIKDEKEQLINKLINFEDGCGEWANVPAIRHGLYKFRGYFLAALGLVEFKDYPMSDEIINQIFEWGLGSDIIDTESQLAYSFLMPIQKKAIQVLEEARLSGIISYLIEIIRDFELRSTLSSAGIILKKIANKNLFVIDSLVDILISSDDNYKKSIVVDILGEIEAKDPKVIQVIENLISNVTEPLFKSLIAENLGRIKQGHPLAVNALTDLCKNNDEQVKRLAALRLLEINHSRSLAFATLESLCIHSQNFKTRRLASLNILEFDQDNKTAIKTLEELCQLNIYYPLEEEKNDDSFNHYLIEDHEDFASNNDERDTSKMFIAMKLKQIKPDNSIATNVLEYMKEHSNNLSVRQTIRQFSEPSNRSLIPSLVKTVCQDNDHSVFMQAGEELQTLLTESQMPQVVNTLKHYLVSEAHQNNRLRFYTCYQVVWYCAQNMSYPDFYQAWND